MITDEIENYPGFPSGVKGPDLGRDMEEQTLRFGAELEFTEVEGLADLDKAE